MCGRLGEEEGRADFGAFLCLFFASLDSPDGRFEQSYSMLRNGPIPHCAPGKANDLQARRGFSGRERRFSWLICGSDGLSLSQVSKTRPGPPIHLWLVRYGPPAKRPQQPGQRCPIPNRRRRSRTVAILKFRDNPFGVRTMVFGTARAGIRSKAQAQEGEKCLPNSRSHCGN